MMKTKKLSLIKKLLIVFTATILLVAGIGMVVLYTLGDRMLEEVIKAELSSIEAEVDSIIDDDIGTGIAEQGSQPGEEDDKPDTSSDSGRTSPAPSPEPEKGGKNPAETPGSTGQQPKPAASVKPSPSSKPASKPGGSPAPDVKPEATPTPAPVKKPPVITASKINEVKDKVSATDKMEAAALALSRLKGSDIDELKAMLPGGLTSEEKARAKEIMYDRFSEEEIERIYEMYGKYMK
jgi:hypothetical protein